MLKLRHYRRVTFALVAAYFAATTLGGLLHVHSHPHSEVCQHAGVDSHDHAHHEHHHAGDASDHASHDHPHAHDHHAEHHHHAHGHHAEHASADQRTCDAHAGSAQARHRADGFNSPGKHSHLHDEDCAVCQFAGQRTLALQLVSLAPLCELSVELSVPSVDEPTVPLARTTHSRAPPPAG